jgi:geranylgeranyl diphosphate synthase, type II
VSPSVEDELARVAALVGAAVPRFLDALAPGPFADIVAEYPRRTGKAFRPALCLATCRAFGGRDEDALEVAVALELLHHAFLVHDDVEDASPERRGRPSLPATYGPALSVHAGDALVVLALGPVLVARRRLGPRAALRVVEELELMARLTIEGQARDLLGLRTPAPTTAGSEPAADAVLRTTLLKTACYSALAPCRLGALVATRGHVDVARFDRLGAWLGLAYQLRDDALDAGEPRRTLAVAHLLERAAPADRRFVERLLDGDSAGAATGDGPASGDGPRTGDGPAARRRLLRLLERHGSLAFVDTVAAALARAAGDEVDVAFAAAPDGPAVELVRDLTAWAVGRSA